MEIDFDKLIELQRLDEEIQNARRLLEGIPQLVENIEKKIEAGSLIEAEAKDKLARNQKRRRELESEAKDLKALVSKYKRQLNEVKTNKEYTAMLREIDEVQHRLEAVEEAVIAEMIAADDIEAEIKSAGQKKAQEEQSLLREKEALNDKAAGLQAAIDELDRRRAALLPSLPPELVRVYETLSRKKGGLALSPIKGDFCSACHMRIRPQMLNEVKVREELIYCENCGRLLYWVETNEKPAVKQ